MTRPSERQPDYERRFPGFDAAARWRHWDDATVAVVMGRLRSPEPPRFFSIAEEAAADALFDRLLAQDDGRRVPVTAMVDARLADGRTDGWHYADMPEDGAAFKKSLAFLDDDATRRTGTRFCDSDIAAQHTLLGDIQHLGSATWHEFAAAHVWSLWTRYACTAFYAHPLAWNEIGFPGPAYPRGYAALGVKKREPFEVADAEPGDDPVAVDDPRRCGDGGGGAAP